MDHSQVYFQVPGFFVFVDLSVSIPVLTIFYYHNFSTHFKFRGTMSDAFFPFKVALSILATLVVPYAFTI